MNFSFSVQLFSIVVIPDFCRSVPLSYCRAYKIVLCAFEAIGLSRRDYGLHSLRAEGAPAAANAQVC